MGLVKDNLTAIGKVKFMGNVIFINVKYSVLVLVNLIKRFIRFTQCKVTNLIH
jgi:hypothetical protein